LRFELEFADLFDFQFLRFRYFGLENFGKKVITKKTGRQNGDNFRGKTCTKVTNYRLPLS